VIEFVDSGCVTGGVVLTGGVVGIGAKGSGAGDGFGGENGTVGWLGFTVG